MDSTIVETDSNVPKIFDGLKKSLMLIYQIRRRSVSASQGTKRPFVMNFQKRTVKIFLKILGHEKKAVAVKVVY